MTRPHTFTALDADLDKIRESILAMGQRVTQAMALATDALVARDTHLAAQVVEGDKAIDALEEDIDAQVVRTLALRQPKADDLRAVVAIMKMAADMERLGDYAKNIAKRVPVLAKGAQFDGAEAAIRRQSAHVGQMLDDMLKAFVASDAGLANDVIARDVEVDHMTNALFREFITHMMEEPRNITVCLHYTFIVKNIERMGDLVTGAAEQVVFLSTGHWPAGREKGASTVEIGQDARLEGGPATEGV